MPGNELWKWYFCYAFFIEGHTATLFQTVVIATGQYQPQVVRMPPAKEGVESGCNNIIRVLHSSSKRKDYSEVKEKSFWFYLRGIQNKLTFKGKFWTKLTTTYIV